MTAARNIEQLPPGKHSVKGLGSTQPDPTEVVQTTDGVEIPLGKGIDAPVDNTSLLYNEYPFTVNLNFYSIFYVKSFYLFFKCFKMVQTTRY